MPDLLASSVSVSFTGTPLFEDVTLTVDPGERIALVGPNGAGKTTFLRVLARQLEPTFGSVTVPSHVRVALHDQRPARSPLPLREYVAPAHMVQAETRLRELELEMASGDDAVMREYERVRADFDHGGGEGWTVLVDQILRGLGFEEHQMQQPLDTFSGGELTRASLARALAQSPDVLLLDEPTNHLDLQSIEWLQEYIEGLRGGLVLVSHDRWFIESTCNSVLEIVGGRSRRFKGSFVEYRAQQAMEAVTHQRQLERWQTEMARVQRFVDRFSAGTRARQAQSRVKLLEKLRKDAPQYADLRNRRALDFRLPKPERSGAVPFDVRGLELGFEHRTLVEPSDFVIERGEKIALLGRNGYGKSTLLHSLAAACITLEDQPEAFRSGEIRVGYGVEARLLSQHDTELIDSMSMLGNMAHVAPKLGRTGSMNLLGLFGFRGQDAERQVSTLSGGERRRLLLAMALTGSANVLLLDEPTNHLDIEGREALEAALADYDGTVILISHDRALVEGVATRIIVLHDRAVQTVVGTFDDARAVMAGEQPASGPHPLQKLAEEAPRKKKPEGKQQRRTVSAGAAQERRSKRTKRSGSPRVRRPKTIEMELEQLETQLGEVQQLMLDPEVYTSPDKSSETLKRHEQLERDIAQRYEELETALQHHGE